MNLAVIIIGIVIAMPVVGILAALAFMFRDEIIAVRLARINGKAAVACCRCLDCCRKNVILSRADLKRLAEHTGRGEREFAVRVGCWKLLRKTASGHCWFLSREHNSSGDEISVCSVYSSRPDACRRFPRLRYLGLNGLDPRCRAVRNAVNLKSGTKP